MKLLSTSRPLSTLENKNFVNGNVSFADNKQNNWEHGHVKA